MLQQMKGQRDVILLAFKREEGHYEPRTVRSLWNLEKPKRKDSLRKPANGLVLGFDFDFRSIGLLTYKAVR